MAEGCSCGGNCRLILACSGAADVGEITDRLARRLVRDGKGKMFCSNGIGAHIDGMIESAKAAGELIAIDGCHIACVKKALDHVGLSARCFNLKTMGYEKGATPCTEDVVNEIAQKMGV
jgi:uncharacterized metal-binding protein